MLINNQYIKKKITQDIKNYLKTNKNEKNLKFTECSKNSSKRKVYNYTGLPKETRKLKLKQY